MRRRLKAGAGMGVERIAHRLMLVVLGVVLAVSVAGGLMSLAGVR